MPGGRRRAAARARARGAAAAAPARADDGRRPARRSAADRGRGARRRPRPGRLERGARASEVDDSAAAPTSTAARAPSPAARALDHKLGGPPGQRRYTAPSYELAARDGGADVRVPGFNPVEAYEAAIANLAPELERRPKPDVRRGGARLGRRAARDGRGRRDHAARPTRRARRARAASHGRPAAGADFYWTLGDAAPGRPLGGFRHLQQPARLDVVDEPVDRDLRGDERVVAERAHIVDDALLPVGDGSQSMLRPSGEPGPCPTSYNAVRPDHGGVETVREQVAHELVRDDLHSAIGMMDDEPIEVCRAACARRPASEPRRRWPGRRHSGSRRRRLRPGPRTGPDRGGRRGRSARPPCARAPEASSAAVAECRDMSRVGRQNLVANGQTREPPGRRNTPPTMTTR